MIEQMKKRHGIQDLLWFLLFFLFIGCRNYIYEEGISIKTMPTKTEYFVGEKLDLTGLVVTSIKEDGSIKELLSEEYTVEPESNSLLQEAGEIPLKITYENRTIEFNIQVNEVKNSKLSIKELPKSAYYEGEKLDLSDLKLELLKTDGSTEIIDTFKSIPEDGSVLEKEANGKKKIKIEYEDVFVEFEIKVYDVLLENIYFKTLPDTLSYYVGDKLDLSGLQLEAIFNDGHKEILSGYTCEPKENTIFDTVEKKVIKLKYLDKEISFNVSVQNSIFMFQEQPKNSSFALYSENQKLSAKILAEKDGTVIFEWFRKNTNESEYCCFYKSEEMNVEAGNLYANEIILPKNDYVQSEYKCRATLAKGNVKKTIESASVTVEQTVDTGLAKVFINTNNVSVISKDTEIPMKMEVYDTNNNRETYTASIRVRGNATAGYPKKPYKIKLNEKEKILGMNKNKNWVLLANYCDKSLMRTALGFKTSELLNMNWTPKAEYVELIINGEYLGNYQIAESVKEGNNRVNISDTGYLIERDGYYYQEPVWFITDYLQAGFSFKYPDNEDITTNIKSYIVDYVNDFETELYVNKDIEKVSSFIDLESWCRWFIVQNILSNGDTNLYYYKDTNTSSSLLYMGPVWDFEWSIGIGWYYGVRPNPNHNWIKHTYFEELMEHEEFTGLVKNIWNNDCLVLKNDLLFYMDELKEKLTKSAEINFKRWDIMNQVVSVGGVPMGGYEEEVLCDKTYLEAHLNWLSSEIDDL